MKDYLIYHNRVKVSVQTILDMAMGSPDYHTAEHYLVSLLFAAKQYEDNWLFSQCKDIMEKFGVSPYPELPASKGNMPNVPAIEEETRQYFKRLTQAAKLDLLRKAMIFLKDATNDYHQKVFSQRQDWMGVYLVLHDRLYDRLPQSHFADFAVTFTPDDWPEDLKINKSTMTNFAKVVTENKPYYMMKENKFQDVCNAFWNIIIKLIRTKTY